MSKKVSVDIHICSNCKQHAWCTRHNQTTYAALAQQLINQIRSRDSNIDIKLYQVGGTKMGSFQVYCESKILFSKLTLGYFPHVTALVNRLINFADDFRNGGDLTKYQLGHSSPIKSNSSYLNSTNSNFNKPYSPNKRSGAKVTYNQQYKEQQKKVEKEENIHVNELNNIKQQPKKEQKQVVRKDVIIPEKKQQPKPKEEVHKPKQEVHKSKEEIKKPKQQHKQQVKPQVKQQKIVIESEKIKQQPREQSKHEIKHEQKQQVVQLKQQPKQQPKQQIKVQSQAKVQSQPKQLTVEHEKAQEQKKEQEKNSEKAKQAQEQKKYQENA